MGKMADKTNISDKYMRILVVDGGGIGDLVMSTPALRAIRNRFSNSHIVLLTVERTVEVIRNLPYFDELICFKQEGFRNKYRLFRWKTLKLNLSLLRDLRKQRFSMIIDLTAVESWKAAILRSIFFKIIGANVHAGRDTDGRGFFLDIKAHENQFGTVHEVERKLLIAKALGARVADSNIEFKVSQKDRKFIDRWLKKKKVSKNNMLVGLNPGSFLPSRRWSKDGFIKIGKQLYDKYGVQVIITGGSKERQLVSDMADKLKDIRPLKFLDFNIRQLGALLERLQLFITNDTGSMHIASALNVPIIAIFGPENHYRYRPYGNGLSKIIVSGVSLSCRPCEKFDCKTHECMESITPDIVWKEVESVMKKLI